MASSTVTGDRRWGGSARRGGMTVLGKVAVPKPINLPSQRLENHGLDPHVEIVPKGTLSWGSRPSSAGSNAWGASALSPSTDGSSSSPSHLLGRPSSGGGTRPSTAGSERAHDSNVNAWGSNSRPSSASGILASNNASSASLRPRSADTRPGSSHLSRFAEPASEASGVWGAAAPERMGATSSAKEGFSLSSGDFPTLGSEKEESKGNMEPPDHSSDKRPGSSGGVRTMSDSRGIIHDDDISRNSDIKGNSWRKNGTPFIEDGPQSCMERWHGEPHLYPNHNMAPPHYESWRGAPPVNPPGGVWYRGPHGPPPYGGPVPPGGFPMEPFTYYHPQVPAPGLANSQPIPPGAGHHGPHSKNGDMPHGPHMPHLPHMHPGIPMRPGFYPGPVPYDGYYRPHIGFCNPSERDLPFMGMPPGPPIYTRHANHNAPDLNNTHPRSREGRGPEQVEHSNSHDPQGHKKFLGGQNDGWSQNDEEKWGPRVIMSASVHEKGVLSKAPPQENSWEDDVKREEDIHYGKMEASSHSSDNKHASINPSRVRFPERLSNIDEAQVIPSMEHVTSPRDHSLIQKIEGLNAKARVTGGKQEYSHRGDQNDRVQKLNTKDNRSSNEADSDVVLERHYPSGVLVPVARNIEVSAVDKIQGSAVASVTTAPRRSVRGAQIRGDSHAKGRSHGQETDGRGKKSDSHFASEAGSRSTSNDQVQEHDVASQIAEVSRTTDVLAKVDGEPVESSVDPSDMQRAKMREIAKQRAIQLQKEEEERVKEQKAKARAKLEELDRRSAIQGVENPEQKETIALPGDILKKQDSSTNQPGVSVDVNLSSGTRTGSFNDTAQLNEKISSKTVDSAIAASNLVAESKKNACQGAPVSFQNQLPIVTDIDDAASHKHTPQVRDVSKQKRGGYKQRQNVPFEKNSMQDAVPAGKSDMVKELKVASSTREVSDSLADAGVGKEQAESPDAAEVPLQRKKTKSGKSRHKIDDSLASVSSCVPQPKDYNLAQAIPESSGQTGSSLHDSSISMASADPKDAIKYSENHSSVSREDTHGRMNSAWKGQHSRKPRNSQGNMPSEKTHSNDAVVWAPVRSHNRVEGTEQTSHKNAEHLVSSAPGDNLAHNNSRTKRAEMERYVPKPVAKELAQLGNTQQPTSLSIDSASTDGSNVREKTLGSEYATKAGASVEPRHVDGKNKHPRAQGSWRQRVSAEQTIVQASHESSTDNTRPDEWSSRPDEWSSRPDEWSSRPDEWSEKGPKSSVSDGWESVNDSSSAFTGEKDHVPFGRGRRHQFKGQKGSGSQQYFDHKDSNVGFPDHYSHQEANQTEKTSSKQNRAAGDRSVSQWQPKFQGYVAPNQQGNRSRGGCGVVTEDRKALKNETGPNGSSQPPSHRNQSAAKDPPPPASQNKSAVESNSSLEHHEAKREKRAQPVKGRPHSPRPEPEALACEAEPASLGAVDGRNEQRPSSGHRKNANSSGRSHRGHEFRGDWTTTAQENKQHYSSTNRERQRHNSHYEYQPVGPYNGSTRSNEPVVQTEGQSGAQRFRDRGQGNNSRRGRGHFHGRQSEN